MCYYFYKCLIQHSFNTIHADPLTTTVIEHLKMLKSYCKLQTTKTLNGWTNGWVDGLIDGWMDGQMDSWMGR